MGRIELPSNKPYGYRFCELKEGTWFLLAKDLNIALYCKLNRFSPDVNCFEISHTGGHITDCRLVYMNTDELCTTVAPNITVAMTGA